MYHTKKDGSKVPISDMQMSHLKYAVSSMVKKSMEGIIVRGKTLIGDDALGEMNYWAYKEEIDRRLGKRKYFVFNHQGDKLFSGSIREIAKQFNYDCKLVSNSIYLGTTLGNCLCILSKDEAESPGVSSMCRSMDKRYVYRVDGSPRYADRKPYKVCCIGKDAESKYTKEQLAEAEEFYNVKNFI